MIGSLFLIFLVFSIALTVVWVWFYYNYKPSGGGSSVGAKLSSGIAFLNSKDYNAAKACFENILKNSPKDFEALLNLGSVLLLQKNYDEAIALINKAIAENGNSVDAYLKLGQVCFEKGDFTKALEAFEKAIAIEPENIEALFGIAKCKAELCNMENDEECQQILDEYLKLADGQDLPSGFHIALAKAYAKQGQLQEAYENCKKALEQNEQDIEIYKLFGLIQLIQKDFAGAKNSLSIALSFQSNNMEIHNIFSYVMCHQEKGCTLDACREQYFELIKKHIK